MKKLISVLLIASMLLTLGCERNHSKSDQELNAKQEQLMEQAVSVVGMPAIKNFQERKMMKEILELRDQENIINYAYIVAEQTGKLIFIGKCIGYGLPYATQYTNPEKISRSNENYAVTMSQADPNGLFMPSSAEGTWLRMVDPKSNKTHVVYIEPRIIVSPFPLDM